MTCPIGKHPGSADAESCAYQYRHPKPSPPATGWTAPSTIPADVARKIIAARDALTNNDIDEAWHQLYSIADPRFESYIPWAVLEAQSNDRR